MLPDADGLGDDSCVSVELRLWLRDFDDDSTCEPDVLALDVSETVCE